MVLYRSSSLNPFVSSPYVSGGDSRQPPSDFTFLAERYRIDRLIGRGGYSSVYQAHDLVRHHDVALKVSESPSCAPEIARTILEHESHMYARVHHPNVLNVFDLHFALRAGAVPLLLLSMEFADGSLRDWLERNRDDQRARVVEGERYFKQMLSGVHAAHKAGIAHRDLKPENFLLFLDGDVVKVGDFGAARTLGRLLLASKSESQVPPHGTPPYMSPEMQANPSLVDKRSDIYALGAIAYEIFSWDCRPPNGGTYHVSDTRHTFSRDIFLPGVSKQMIHVIRKCLEPIEWPDMTA